MALSVRLFVHQIRYSAEGRGPVGSIGGIGIVTVWSVLTLVLFETSTETDMWLKPDSGLCGVEGQNGQKIQIHLFRVDIRINCAHL